MFLRSGDEGIGKEPFIKKYLKNFFESGLKSYFNMWRKLQEVNSSILLFDKFNLYFPTYI